MLLLLLLLLLLINFEWPCGSDFKVDGRFSHRRNVNLIGDDPVPDPDPDVAGKDKDDEADDVSDPLVTCVKMGIEMIMPVTLSYTTSFVFTIFLWSIHVVRNATNCVNSDSGSPLSWMYFCANALSFDNFTVLSNFPQRSVVLRERS